MFLKPISTKNEESKTLDTVMMAKTVKLKKLFCYCLHSLKVTIGFFTEWLLRRRQLIF